MHTNHASILKPYISHLVAPDSSSLFLFRRAAVLLSAFAPAGLGSLPNMFLYSYPDVLLSFSQLLLPLVWDHSLICSYILIQTCCCLSLSLCTAGLGSLPNMFLYSYPDVLLSFSQPLLPLVWDPSLICSLILIQTCCCLSLNLCSRWFGIPP